MAENLHSPDEPKTIFKSAFGHALRTSAPVPVPEHLSHFSCALLQGKYTFKVGKDAESGRLSLELALPEYDQEGFVESELVLESGVELDEEGQKMLEQIRATTSPCSMVCQNSCGALKTMFETLQSMTVGSVDSVKKGSMAVVKAALDRLKTKSELVKGRTITEMDSLIAEAEKEILAGLLELAAAEGDLVVKEYLQKAQQLHSQLELDDTIDDDEPSGCCGGGSCCGDGGCCDDEDEEDCHEECHDHSHQHSHSHSHSHQHSHSCCHGEGEHGH